MIRHIVFFVAVTVVATHIFRLAYYLGYFKTIINHQPGSCRLVPGIENGAEDITVSSDGLAFISSGIAGKGYITDPRACPPNIKGRIFLFDIRNPEDNVKELTLQGDFDRENFFPHGISLYEAPDTGEKRLFVVSHHPTTHEDKIEIFRFDKRTYSLIHLKTVTGKTLYSVNDLVVLGPETFYFSNDHYFVKPSLRQIEGLALLGWGSIGFYNNGEEKIVASGFHFANGINVSPDHKYIYLAEAMSGDVSVFEIQKDYSLVEKKKIHLNIGVDNIEIDKPTGELWIGCHPRVKEWFDFSQNIDSKAGAQVLRIQFGSDLDKVNVTDVFVDDGGMLKGGSSASFYRNRLLIGTVAHKMAYCEIGPY
ncbi:serum paraoxonase/arylesterase 1-like [Ptychodera flava]|uniref:serum paraoxonase/arylesterase 1-like n=1 Tax=Ptychodera flava TaxID=63121 RepID=UPI003969FEE6